MPKTQCTNCDAPVGLLAPSCPACGQAREIEPETLLKVAQAARNRLNAALIALIVSMPFLGIGLLTPNRGALALGWLALPAAWLAIQGTLQLRRVRGIQAQQTPKRRY